MDQLEVNCGTKVSQTCEGATIPMTPVGFQILVGEAVSAITFLLTSITQMAGAALSLNQQKALNAARCAVTNLGENQWNWLASAYYMLLEFGAEQ